LRELHSALRRTRLEGPLQVSVSAERQSLRGTLSQDALVVSADVVKRGALVDVRSLRARANGGEASGAVKIALGGPVGVTGDLAFSRFDPSQFGDYPGGAIDATVVLR